MYLISSVQRFNIFANIFPEIRIWDGFINTTRFLLKLENNVPLAIKIKIP